jgi:hypothetical protein
MLAMDLVLLQRAQKNEFTYVFFDMVDLRAHCGQWNIQEFILLYPIYTSFIPLTLLS